MTRYPDAGGRTPLHYVAADKSLSTELTRLIQTQADVNARDNEGWTPLAFASQAGNVGAARQLVGAGAEIDTVDATGNTPLWRAVFNFDRGNVVELLLAQGADPDRKNLAGVSPRELAHKIANNDVKQYFS